MWARAPLPRAALGADGAAFDRAAEVQALQEDDVRRDAAWSEHLRRHPLRRNAFKDQSKSLARAVREGVGPTYRPLVRRAAANTAATPLR
jgi:hypothetical protein